MNFQELCQETARLCEITGTISDVASATGEHERVVTWTRNAWVFIQNLHDDWAFLRALMSFSTVIGQSAYGQSDMGSGIEVATLDPDSFSCWLTASGRGDEQYLHEVSEDDWRTAFETGQQTNQRPQYFAWNRTNGSMLLAPAPDAVYTISGYYWAQPVHLAVNADTPAIHRSLHMIVPYRAAMMYANRESAPELKLEAVEGYQALLSRMERQYLPGIEFGA